MRKNTWMSLVLAISLVLSCGSMLAVEKSAEGHQFGKWPTTSAMIHHEFQKNLDLDTNDFLFEIWFSPLPVIPYKANGGVLISKKCNKLLRGYSLSCKGKDVTLTLCDDKTELNKDHNFTVNAGLTVGEWCYLAVAYSHKEKTLTFFKNGKKLKSFKNVVLGNLSNNDTFNVGYFENRGNTNANCQISEVRIWKFRNALPDDITSLIENDAADPTKPAAALIKNADYSSWTFTASNEEIIDRGNNGNKLCYVPFGYKDRVKLIPFPETPTGKTFYVDQRNPQASDKNDGSKENPFKTITRGLKATHPGDLLHICAGIYREKIYPRAGINGKPVTIEGEEGTIISGSVALKGWEPEKNGLWVVNGWNGEYEKPRDPKVSDARSAPGNRIFLDDEPLDFVKTRQELVPGTWTVEPMLARGPKKFLLNPPPGIDPSKSEIEITVSNLGRLIANKFTHVRNLRFLRCGVALRGIRNILENCSIEWTPFVSLSIGGQDQIVRKNKILWGGNSGIGGSSIRLLFEDNLLSYNGWCGYSQGWHGGAVKLIPGNIDHIFRNNVLKYNDIAAIWYDAWNQGNLIEGNHCHDNSGHGGIFDEISFGNTIRDNISYNNYGHGICIGESSEEVLYRNIVFNNYLCGIFFRSDGSCSASLKENSPETQAALKKKFLNKLDLRRYYGFISYEREKPFRDMVVEYWCKYPARSYGRKNKVFENVVFDNFGWGGIEVNQLVKYVKGLKVSPDRINTFDKNIYWNSKNPLIFSNGRHCTKDLDFKTWQELSGQDKNSRFMNPWPNMDKMPEWFRERFKFKQNEFRPIGEVFDTYLANLKKSSSRTVLMSRLLRSKNLKKIEFNDPLLFGCYFDMDNKRCAAIWSKSVGVRAFMLPGITKVTCESKYLKKRTLDAKDNRVNILVGEAPITLIGIGDQIMEDRSVVVEVPMWTEPGKPVPAKLILENLDSTPSDYNLNLSIGDGWKITNAKIQKTLKPGEKINIELPVSPPENVRQGMFQLNVSGSIKDKKVEMSKNFGIGSLLVLKPMPEKPKIDGDLADWGALGIPNGIGEAKNQVVFGADNWKGSDDLSAKVWLRWDKHRELYVAIEVTDDRVVTKNAKEAPLNSDSVQIMVDTRAEWKHFMNNCTPGTFNLTLLPGDEKTPATATYGRLRFGSIRGVASRRTEKGYIIELDIHFHTAEVEDPGWVTNRPIRIGILVNDSDNPEIKDRKSTIGVWRTADDAVTNCASLTTFVTEE